MVPAGKRAPTPTAEIPVLPGPRQLTSTDDVKLPRVYLAWHSPALYTAEDAALDVLSSILTDGKTSRLYQPLVYEQKVAKDVSVDELLAAPYYTAPLRVHDLPPISDGAAAVVLTDVETALSMKKAVAFRAYQHVNDYLPMSKRDVVFFGEEHGNAVGHLVAGGE